jgi:dimethylargininase
MNATGTLRRVLLRPPRTDELANWSQYGWRAEPDPVAIAREHEELCILLSDAGAEVVLSEEPVQGDPDAIYAYDPVLIGPSGAVLLRIGKPGRVAEAEALVPALEAAGIPVAARMDARATADGGDIFWLDERTVLVGRGYRTNNAGIAAIRTFLPFADVIAFDLPHLRGRGEVLHLMSLVSPLSDDLVVAFMPLLPVRLVELFEERGIEIVRVPEYEFESMGANVLALAPRVGLALARNTETRRRLERAGVTVQVYEGTELSKGDGGPTCLTRPLLRD